MGSSVSQCCAQDNESNKFSKEITLTSVKPEQEAQTNEDNDDMDEFISQYGSYFSISTPSTDDSVCSSTSGSTTCSEYGSSYEYSSSAMMNTPIPSTPARSSTNDIGFNLSFDHCMGIHNCEATNRIIEALKLHSNNNNDILVQKLMENGNDKSLLDDYQHILSVHLLDLAHIRSKVNNEVNEYCNVTKCVSYQRFEQLSTKDLSQCDDETFCVDFMDLIHCYILHSQ